LISLESRRQVSLPRTLFILQPLSVVSSSERGPRIRQYCFGTGAPAIKRVRLCSRVPSPPRRTSVQKDSLVGFVIPV